MSTKHCVFALAVGIVFCVPCWTSAQTTTDIQARLDGFVAKLVADHEIPGASLAIVLPDGKTMTAVAGVAERGKPKRLTAEDRMMSGSIGKTYFSALALKMVLAGKLSLDDKVSRYLGKEPWFGRIANSEQITIAHLMRHQSGIPRYVLDPKFFKDLLDRPDSRWDGTQQLTYILNKPAVHPAGKGWAYSDTNYILLGLTLEKISGKKVYQSVETEFLKPLKLNKTRPSNRRVLPGLVQGESQLFQRLGVPRHVIADGKFVVNPEFEWCGGGYYCTPADLARWGHLLYSGKAMDGDYVELMTAGAVDAPMLGPNTKYGLGVMIRQREAGRVLGHDGVMPGYASAMVYVPKTKMAGALQINIDNGRAVRRPLADVLLEAMQLTE